MRKAIIFLNGAINIDDPFYSKIIGNGDIFCADGGANHLFRLGGIPKLILGDLDSLLEDVYTYYKNKGVPFTKLPSFKNETDGELIMQEVESFGYDEILVLGGMGGRTDHFLTNINLMTKFKTIRLVSETEEIFFVNKNHVICDKKGFVISFIPLSEIVESISLEGFKYPLKDFRLQRGSSRCTSNIITSQTASIKYNEGMLIGILNKKMVIK